MNLLRDLSRAFLKAVFAGILIGIAGFGYLVNPIFVMTGMAHCVADWFYFSLADRLDTAEMWSYCFISLITVLGNAFGCNIYRLCLVKSE